MGWMASCCIAGSLVAQPRPPPPEPRYDRLLPEHIDVEAPRSRGRKPSPRRRRRKRRGPPLITEGLPLARFELNPGPTVPDLFEDARRRTSRRDDASDPDDASSSPPRSANGLMDECSLRLTGTPQTWDDPNLQRILEEPPHRRSARSTGGDVSV